MSYNGMVVVDADTHVREYEDVDRVYPDYIDSAYRGAFDNLSRIVAQRREAGLPTALFMHPQAIIEPADESRPLGVYDTFSHASALGRPRTKAEARGEKEVISREVHWDPQVRLADLDRAGVDSSIMFPSHAASYCTLQDVGFEAALHQALHRYMSHYCAEAEGRLRYVFTVTTRDIPGSVAELTYWAERDNNMVGVLLPPACVDGSLLDTPALHPIYQRAQDLDLPILVHGGVLRPPYTAGATELNNSGFLLRAMYQPWAGMTAMGALIGGGVFDLFPTLRVGIFETSGGWVPWLVERLDESASRPHLVPNLKRKPSDIVAEGRFFHAVESEEKHLAHCIADLGEDIWLFATDYPHTGSPWPHGVQDIADRPELSASAKTKLLGANALRLCPRLAN